MINIVELPRCNLFYLYHKQTGMDTFFIRTNWYGRLGDYKRLSGLLEEVYEKGE